MRFRCPHCRQKTITLAERLKANAFRPRACPQCGGRNTPAAWAILPGALLFPFLVSAPLLLVGGGSEPVFIALIVGGFVLATAGWLLAYLCVPLLRHGSRLARFESWSFLAAVVGVVLYAVLKPESPGPPPPEIVIGKPTFSKGAMGRSFSDPEKQAEWKEALEEAKIPYRLEQREGGKEFVWVEPQYRQAVEQMERDVWGIPLGPEKSNVQFGDPKTTEEFRAWLVARGTPHKVYGTKKRPVIAWDGPDNLTLEFMKSRIPSGAPSDCDKVAAAPAVTKRC
jgi:hypothetical protein